MDMLQFMIFLMLLWFIGAMVTIVYIEDRKDKQGYHGSNKAYKRYRRPTVPVQGMEMEWGQKQSSQDRMRMIEGRSRMMSVSRHVGKMANRVVQ